MPKNLLEGYAEFLKLRRYLLDALGKIDMECHKSYEGTFELLLSYPCYFDDEAGGDEPDAVTITLHCYVIGPSRHYSWSGATLAKAVQRARKDIERWVAEAI